MPDERNGGYSEHDWPHFYIPSLFSDPEGSSGEFSKCIVHYFRRLAANMPTGKVVFTRVGIPGTQ